MWLNENALPFWIIKSCGYGWDVKCLSKVTGSHLVLLATVEWIQSFFGSRLGWIAGVLPVKGMWGHLRLPFLFASWPQGGEQLCSTETSHHAFLLFTARKQWRYWTQRWDRHQGWAVIFEGPQPVAYFLQIAPNSSGFHSLPTVPSGRDPMSKH